MGASNGIHRKENGAPRIGIRLEVRGARRGCGAGCWRNPLSDRQLRLLVCGDRNWTDGGLIADWLSTLRGDNPDMLLCHGANGVSHIDGHTVKPDKSADAWANWWALLLDIPVTAFPAEWAKYGKRAGPIRNRQMLKEFRPTDVLAFHNLLERSKGTKDMMTAASKTGIPVMHVTTACPTGTEWVRAGGTEP